MHMPNGPERPVAKRGTPAKLPPPSTSTTVPTPYSETRSEASAEGTTMAEQAARITSIIERIEVIIESPFVAAYTIYRPPARAGTDRRDPAETAHRQRGWQRARAGPASLRAAGAASARWSPA